MIVQVNDMMSSTRFYVGPNSHQQMHIDGIDGKSFRVVKDEKEFIEDSSGEFSRDTSGTKLFSLEVRVDRFWEGEDDAKVKEKSWTGKNGANELLNKVSRAWMDR